MTEPGAQHTELRQPLHILIVEDNADGRESLRALLTLYGYHVDVAVDGQEGVEKARLLHPDVALVDIGLPRMDGYEVARHMRAELGTDLRLMACTAYGDPESRQHALEAGFDCFQVKPVDPACIVSWLSEQLTD